MKPVLNLMVVCKRANARHACQTKLERLSSTIVQVEVSVKQHSQVLETVRHGQYVVSIKDGGKLSVRELKQKIRG